MVIKFKRRGKPCACPSDAHLTFDISLPWYVQWATTGGQPQGIAPTTPRRTVGAGLVPAHADHWHLWMLTNP
ncbi:hypothetical protein [Methyloglobulus sp.]|uniref:hypothetical protein n=1 Tax=Methyloglobulus sp. TaxID=2518622 RepID=UPI0039897270